MSFQNLPAQLTALLLGWMFTLYLQYVANRRTEALKRKEKIIDKLDDLSDWVESEISKDNFSATDTEEAFGGILLHIELRINQFNAHVGQAVIDSGKIASLRDVDFFEASGLKKLPYIVRAHSSQLIEEIELECNKLYFADSLLRRVMSFLAELYGVIVAIVALILAVLLGYLVNLAAAG